VSPHSVSARELDPLQTNTNSIHSGLGLVYHATSKPTDAVLVTSQVLVGAGGAVSIISSYIGVQGSVPHQDMAIATAVLNLISSVGSSITVAVSSSVWNQEVPRNLEKYIGATHNATQRAEIFGSIYVARLAEPRDLVKQGKCNRQGREHILTAY
jgi:hypothetical protein